MTSCPHATDFDRHRNMEGISIGYKIYAVKTLKSLLIISSYFLYFVLFYVTCVILLCFILFPFRPHCKLFVTPSARCERLHKYRRIAYHHAHGLFIPSFGIIILKKILFAIIVSRVLRCYLQGFKKSINIKFFLHLTGANFFLSSCTSCKKRQINRSK